MNTEQEIKEFRRKNQRNVIEIVEKGEPFLFGPSSIRIKSKQQHIDRSIFDDGARPNAENISIEWTDEGTALITLDKDEQPPEFILFNSQNSPFFETIQVEMEETSLATSQSPDQTNQIEIKKIARSEGKEFVLFIRIYYGEYGSELEEYRDIDYVFGADEYSIEWVSNQLASIRIFNGNEIIETHEVDFTKKKPDPEAFP